MKKKIVAMMLAMALVLSMAGCSATTDGQSTDTGSVQNDTSADGSQSDSSDDGDGAEQSDADEWLYCDAVTVDDALQVVANLNSCTVEDLNYSLDDKGYVNFLGANFTDKKVFSAEDALACIDDLVILAGAEGCEYVYFRDDVSPVSGYTYYVFNQVVSSDIDDMVISYSNAQIRVIANDKGDVMGFSADVSPVDDVEKIDESNFVDQIEAEELVKSELSDGAQIFSDMTELSYWDDLNSVGNIISVRVAPVWVIYTNEVKEGKPYTIYLVYASRVNDEAVIVDRVATSTLKVMSDEYTSEIFFEGMEDGGYVEYTIDMEWAKQVENGGYVAGDTMQVKVPIMYSPSQELYYLADYNDRIAVANCYDFNDGQEVNALVTEDPSDLYSWRFASMEGPDGQKYFCNPEYVITAYATMEKAFHIYKERYGYTSIDTSGMPILLLTYLCWGDYPEEVEDMVMNANSMGQWHDWAVFGTSPTFVGCVEVGTMTHEFAHGINGALTNFQYSNEEGAVMEGYADSIGEFLAYMYGYKDEAYKDVVGSEFSSPIRSFANPYDFKFAKYIGGPYYAWPVDSSLAAEFDNGGVHSNSSVVNYLAYSLFNNENPDAATLSMGQMVDLFLETLYCANYNTGYTELGAYLLFAADSVGLDDATNAYVHDTIVTLGFTGDYSALEKLIEEEGAVGYQISLTPADDDTAAELDDVTFGVWLINYEEDEYYLAGMLDENLSITYYLPEEASCDAYIYISIKGERKSFGFFFAEDMQADENNVIPIAYDTLKPGEVIEFEEKLSCISYCDLEDEDPETISLVFEESDTSYCFENAGLYCVSLLNEEDNYELLFLYVE
ncbi:MAG: M4 family metallopeptidase [Lachnospiraceae bacterium]|nr:M4 family metallopeptidase [Candidatus Merdinaster equi]